MFKTTYCQFSGYFKFSPHVKKKFLQSWPKYAECKGQLSSVKKTSGVIIMYTNNRRAAFSLLSKKVCLPVPTQPSQMGCAPGIRHLSKTRDTPDPSQEKVGDKNKDGATPLTKQTPISPAASPLPGTLNTQPAEPLSESNTTVFAPPSPEIDAAEKKKIKVLRVTPRMRKPNPIDYSYTGNIYILPERALAEYLLQARDLEDLPKYTRRSPYAEGTRITLYLRTDVEDIALSKWGSFDKLNKEKAKLRTADTSGKYDINELRVLLGEMYSPLATDDSSKSQSTTPEAETSKEPTFWSSGSTKVVLSAILVNGANTLFKLVAWLYTGSHSMFSEFIHSCADTMNQIILVVGLYHSFKKPDTDHPYGYRNLRNISSLISGVGIFFFGTGLSYYHSLLGFLHPQDLGSLNWCLATLLGSFISEGATLFIAMNQVRKSALEHQMSFKEYLFRGMDPNVNVVLLEDFAAVTGVVLAGGCITLSSVTGSSVPDALGSALIGTLLGVVAAFIIHQNTLQLVGRSIPLDERQDISQLMETDRMIRSLHDVKATQMGGVVRFKAEVDFDGREITRAYLYKQDVELLLQEAQNLKTAEELENFMLNHGEKIIDELGAQVDRIEKTLKSKHPEIRHVDLEAL